MSKIDEVRKAMVEAMKAKDKERKDSLSMLLSALKNKAIDKREDLTEAEENEVVLKEIKQTKETLEMTAEDRTDIIDECTKRIAVYEEFAPKMLSEEEIKEVIQGVLAELSIETPTSKDKGKIMKVLMPKVKGDAEGKEENKVQATMLQKKIQKSGIQKSRKETAAVSSFLLLYTIFYFITWSNNPCRLSFDSIPLPPVTSLPSLFRI